MKRLYPALLVLASLVSAVVFTTVTALTLSSYAKDSKPAGTEHVVSVDHSTAKR